MVTAGLAQRLLNFVASGSVVTSKLLHSQSS